MSPKPALDRLLRALLIHSLHRPPYADHLLAFAMLLRLAQDRLLRALLTLSLAHLKSAVLLLELVMLLRIATDLP